MLDFKKLRKELNMTQVKFANKVNISLISVKNWEQGISKPNVNTLEKIADKLNITYLELIKKLTGGRR